MIEVLFFLFGQFLIYCGELWSENITIFWILCDNSSNMCFAIKKANFTQWKDKDKLWFSLDYIDHHSMHMGIGLNYHIIILLSLFLNQFSESFLIDAVICLIFFQKNWLLSFHRYGNSIRKNCSVFVWKETCASDITLHICLKLFLLMI